MPKIYEYAKNIPETKERRRTFVLDTTQNQWRYLKVPFLATVKLAIMSEKELATTNFNDFKDYC